MQRKSMYVHNYAKYGWSKLKWKLVECLRRTLLVCNFTVWHRFPFQTSTLRTCGFAFNLYDCVNIYFQPPIGAALIVAVAVVTTILLLLINRIVPNFVYNFLFLIAFCSLGWSPALLEWRWCGGGDRRDSLMSLSRWKGNCFKGDQTESEAATS